MQSLAPLIVGAIALLGIIYRVRTIDTHAYHFSVKVNVFMFTALGLGLLLTNPYVPSSPSMPQGFGRWLLLAASLIYPIMIFTLLGRKLRDILRDANVFLYGGFVLICWLAVFFGFGAVIFKIQENTGATQTHLGAVWFFILGPLFYLPIMGFIHALLGPVIAAFNLALLVGSILQGAHSSFSLSTLFDLLEFIGIQGIIFKWALYIASTVLAMSELLDPSRLKDKLGE
jgi:hypothetical protein